MVYLIDYFKFLYNFLFIKKVFTLPGNNQHPIITLKLFIVLYIKFSKKMQLPSQLITFTMRNGGECKERYKKLRNSKAELCGRIGKNPSNFALSPTLH